MDNAKIVNQFKEFLENNNFENGTASVFLTVDDNGISMSGRINGRAIRKVKMQGNDTLGLENGEDVKGTSKVKSARW